MKIIFDCLGFSNAIAFVVKNGRQYSFGSIRNLYSRNGDEYKFYPEDFINHYVERGYITNEEIPTGEQTIAEYKKQWKACNNKSQINKEIQYAG